jgi:hypothetical protein
VEQEFRDFLICGVRAHGFARLRCTECSLERLVPFSCKGRGFCQSCGGRRMTECAARLVDRVLSTAPRHAHLAGFDLHANVAVPATDRARLEQVQRMGREPG